MSDNWKTKPAKGGSLLCVTSGCYSDFGLNGFFVVLADFVPGAELDEYLAGSPSGRKQYSFSGDGFIAHLIRKGLLLELSPAELHLGDYGNVNEVYFRPAGNGEKE
jgi:hypothetical protein